MKNKKKSKTWEVLVVVVVVEEEEEVFEEGFDLYQMNEGSNRTKMLDSPKEQAFFLCFWERAKDPFEEREIPLILKIMISLIMLEGWWNED